jgi:hypothetical protein
MSMESRVSYFKTVVLCVLLLGFGTACNQDDVKIIDVPRKDIPKDMYNKPIPPEAFKTMPPAARKQLKKTEAAIRNTKTE